MQEREISLVDLIVEILLRWRVIIVAMLIGAVALGGFSYFRSARTAKANQAKIKELEQQLQSSADGEEGENGTADKKWLEDQLTQTQIVNVETVLTNEQLYSDKVAYCENSVYMQTDANHVPKYDFTFWVQGASTEETNYIVQTYEDIFVSGGMYEYLADKMNIDPDYIVELIALERSVYGQYLPVNTVRGYVRYNTEEGCRQLAQLAIDYMLLQQKNVEKTMGSHSLVLTQQSYAAGIDTSLLNAQKTYQTDLLAMKTAIAKAKDAFTEEEWKYYNFLTTGKATGDPHPKTEESDEEGEEETLGNPIELELTALRAASTPRVSKKYILLGMILAAFAYAFVIFLKYILDSRLRATDDIQELYGISKLGQIPAEPAVKKMFGFVDKWILSIRNIGKRCFSAEEAVSLAAVAVKISAQKQGLSTVYCLGCGLKGKALEICNTLKEQLAGENIELKVLNNVLYDAQALEELADAKGAFLLETAGVTFYDEITQELALLKRQEIAVMGGIVVE